MGDDPSSRICDWDDSSFLTVARVFPGVGGRLLKHCLKEWPVRLSDAGSDGASKTPRISIILPVGGKERIPLCKCVVEACWGQSFNDLAIVIVEHGEEPLYAQVYSEVVNYIFLQRKPGQQFNKSMAINAGVDNSASPYLLIHDADVVPADRYVESIFVLLDAGWHAVRPVRFIFHLDPKGSATFLGSSGISIPKTVASVQQNNPGISTAVRRDVYEAIGGHDERFEGWGGEDLEFLDRLKTTKLYPGSYAPSIHLWHAPSPKKADGDRNNRILAEKRALSPAQRIELLRGQLSKREEAYPQ